MSILSTQLLLGPTVTLAQGGHRPAGTDSSSSSA